MEPLVYDLTLLENGNVFIRNNKEEFYTNKLDKNIYFVEKNKIIRDSVLLKHYYKPELMKQF